MFIAMHNIKGNTYRSFSNVQDAIAWASTQGANMAVHAPAGNIVWRSEYA